MYKRCINSIIIIIIISLENKTFKRPVLVLESPIAKPFPQFTSFFIAVELPNTIQHNIPKKNEDL